MDDEGEAQKSAQIQAVFFIWRLELDWKMSALQSRNSFHWNYLSLEILENLLQVYVFRPKRQTQTRQSLVSIPFENHVKQ